MSDLDLGVVGNCCFAALIDRDARVVWCCAPRFDGDPVFHCLLGAPKDAEGSGVFAIELEDHTQSEQHYDGNTAILVTTLHGKHGSLRVTDFAPRFWWRDRPFFPQTLVRQTRANFRQSTHSNSPASTLRLWRDGAKSDMGLASYPLYRLQHDVTPNHRCAR